MKSAFCVFNCVAVSDLISVQNSNEQLLSLFHLFKTHIISVFRRKEFWIYHKTRSFGQLLRGEVFILSQYSIQLLLVLLLVRSERGVVVVKLHERRLFVVLFKNILVHLEINCAIQRIKLVVIKSCFKNAKRKVVFKAIFALVVQIMNLLESFNGNDKLFWLRVLCPRYLHFIQALIQLHFFNVIRVEYFNERVHQLPIVPHC